MGLDVKMERINKKLKMLDKKVNDFALALSHYAVIVKVLEEKGILTNDEYIEAQEKLANKIKFKKIVQGQNPVHPK